MKLIIDVDEKLVCEGFERSFTEEERTILIRAIGNGTAYNPSGDCISREALKETIVEPLNVNDAGKNDWYDGYYTAKNEDVAYIDNAQAVEPRIEYGTDGQPYKLSMTNDKEFERPQGEWKVVHTATGETKYKCNKCQHYIKIGDDKNFCPNCGAKMKGGAK